MLTRARLSLIAAAMVCAATVPAQAGPPVVSATPAPAPSASRLPVYRPPVNETPAPTVGKPRSLGMIGIKSIHERYLQAHTDGELHASNEHRNTEETWFLVEVEKARHVYALQNYRTGHFMSKRSNGCAPADSAILGPTEKWFLVGGKRYGIDNAVALKSYVDGTFLGANGPGNDDRCGGEVSAHTGGTPPAASSWAGWWMMEPATTPTAGHDVWSAVSGVAGGITDFVLDAGKATILPIDPVELSLLEKSL